MRIISQEIIEKRASLAVIGLGYVGLPIALAFAKKIKVIGFDINPERIKMMQARQDPSQELSAEDFEGCDITFTHQITDLASVRFFIVAVPTPIDEHSQPNLTSLLSASATVGKVLKKGDYVVFESTVYPGCTEEDCVPILEQESGLKFLEDFKVGYSPERINPGDKEHTLKNIIKVVSGCDAESLEEISKIYELVVEAGLHRAPSIKVAEAAKIIENTQRDVNIALMNELSLIFDKMNINTYDVLEAAGTKWNFLKFVPGLVGGHCIGVDPYYLTHKAKELGYTPAVILSGRAINDSMGAYIAKKTVQKIIKNGVNPAEARALVMGVTFKENVSDIRNSKVVDVIRELQSFSIQVDAIDPFAQAEEFWEEYHLQLSSEVRGKYDAIILAVSHKNYLQLQESDFLQWAKPQCVFIDIKGIFRKKIHKLFYWSL
ncbi:MAG: Vi polysaccharide biosynthesis UDP-N-acetylglucosamine C-6 dehydrogenase TviB [Raineya sp.]